jgi:hypothetical protein
MPLKRYKDWSPTSHDTKGLGLDGENGRQDWYVAPVIRTRDSGPLQASNFFAAEARLAKEGPLDYEVHRFGHWVNGWFEIILIRPGTACAAAGQALADCLADYPILDEEDYTERLWVACDETWASCYNNAGRIEYMRQHCNDIRFASFAAMLSAARGRYFPGDPDEMVSES